MRAAWYDRQGPAAEVLRGGELPTPEPGPGEARVRLRASGANPADMARRAGPAHVMEGPRIIPHSDGAGVVDAVGPGADPGLIGRRVWLYNGQRGGRAHGTAAEAIALDASLLTPLPDHVSFEEGACLGIPCMTAWACVHSDGPVTGKTVLVTGGAGAVGNYAVQHAVRDGARVIATVSDPESETAARAAGAHAVLRRDAPDLADEILEAASGPVDRIVEVDLGGDAAVAQRVIGVNGVIAAYASRGDPRPALDVYGLLRRNVTLRMFLLPISPLPLRQAAQAAIAAWLSNPAQPARHAVAARFPLADIAAAHQAIEAGGKRGTVVLLPDR